MGTPEPEHTITSCHSGRAAALWVPEGHSGKSQKVPECWYVYMRWVFKSAPRHCLGGHSPQAHVCGGCACRPCSDEELLLAACTSDFVIRGTIHRVTHDMELQESVITVVATHILRQTLPLLGMGGPAGQGQAFIRTQLRCGVRPGPGTFLFMGWSRFGEAWLGCAPRVQEFTRAYTSAQAAHLHPCEVTLD
uniref:Adenine nucleotide translocase lysine methyltransferase n=1 Tax=Spermophilus dauricus TaxID=99837 RepID=A0A8C9QFC9_SPEDA